MSLRTKKYNWKRSYNSNEQLKRGTPVIIKIKNCESSKQEWSVKQCRFGRCFVVFMICNNAGEKSPELRWELAVQWELENQWFVTSSTREIHQNRLFEASNPPESWQISIRYNRKKPCYQFPSQTMGYSEKPDCDNFGMHLHQYFQVDSFVERSRNDRRYERKPASK